jgi:hypothetical protein
MSKADFPKAYIKKLPKDAYANSYAKVKDKKQLMQGRTITKSISPVKTKPGAGLKKQQQGTIP